MVTNFFVFGSCNSRDIFNSNFNRNYKEFFKICGDSQRASLISLMNNPIDFDESKTRVYSEYDSTLLDTQGTKMLREDLSKNFLKTLKNGKDVDYLLMDNLYEVDCGILELFDGTFITNSPDLLRSKLYGELDKKRTITIQNNTNEYFKIFKEHCNLFFEFMDKYCPNLKVILNVTRYGSKIIKDNGEIYENDEFKLQSKIHNKYRRMFDNYIMKTFDVEILPFNSNTLILESHPFGYMPSHFEFSYLTEKTKQMNDIILRNKILNEDTNKHLRRLHIEKFILIDTLSKDFDENIIKRYNAKLNNEYNFIEEKLEKLCDYLTSNHDSEFFFDPGVENYKNANYKNHNKILSEISNKGTKIYSDTPQEGFYYINHKLNKNLDYIFSFIWNGGEVITPIIQIREIENMGILTTFQKGQDDIWNIYTNNPISSPNTGIVDFTGIKTFKQKSINLGDMIKLVKTQNNIKVFCKEKIVINYDVEFNSDFYIGFGGHAGSGRNTIVKDISLKLIKN